MRNLITSLCAALMTMILLTGCIGLSIGGGSKSETTRSTVGQELVDLQKAKDSGAISDAEYQAQRNKILQRN
jgi:hypothetical protein